MSATTTKVTAKDAVKRIGDTTERALSYVQDPDPQLSRLPKSTRESLVADLPPVTAGALLGPAALARHLVASAASGRYRDLFALWELFRTHPDECRPVLADRPQALEKARAQLRTAVRLGLVGQADRVAEDVRAAQGLIWEWLRENLQELAEVVSQRPVVASAVLDREPDFPLPLPDEPDARWLSEAAEVAADITLHPEVSRRLAEGVDRLPPTVATLILVADRYPDRVDVLLDRVDLDSPEIEATLAWARDHGRSERLHARVREQLERAAHQDRAEALAVWRRWQERGVPLELPAAAKAPTLDGLDLTRPETASFIALLAAEGVDLAPQEALEKLAGENRQRAEKAYEALVCADLPVGLPKALEGNPIVKEGTRCPHCLAWTWVRPGHEARCPQQARAQLDSTPGDAATEAAANDATAAPSEVSPTAAGDSADGHLGGDPTADAADADGTGSPDVDQQAPAATRQA
ncbi:hypothetical protein ER308_18470 [Egibacter rhizosphaerae]|uniref:Uncharacterized protein n=1 Tax=Egibacter rhizosphaerae TaxID=1670831 RepID=A0A411YJ71_9ACTN|nr:hypothetical protein [Egibacter rhizosphaerae]QBI21355.1 hypothetical protein ER308_18470 [Egibacter rhizosphaerae]